jgi:hypothetical protein
MDRLPQVFRRAARTHPRTGRGIGSGSVLIPRSPASRSRLHPTHRPGRGYGSGRRNARLHRARKQGLLHRKRRRSRHRRQRLRLRLNRYQPRRRPNRPLPRVPAHRSRSRAAGTSSSWLRGPKQRRQLRRTSTSRFASSVLGMKGRFHRATRSAPMPLLRTLTLRRKPPAQPRRSRRLRRRR